MDVVSSSRTFKLNSRSGLEFLLANEGPLSDHFTEGKDKAGFVSALLEALMGNRPGIREISCSATVNYHGVEYGSRAARIAESNVLAALPKLARPAQEKLKVWIWRQPLKIPQAISLGTHWGAQSKAQGCTPTKGRGG